MHYSINKFWILLLVAGASLSLFLVFMTQAQPEGGLAQSRTTPLSPNHPDAKLDPNLGNVSPMPEQNTDSSQRYPLAPNDPDAQLDPSLINVPAMPEQSTPSEIRPTQTPEQEVNYNPRTGTTGVGETRAVKPSPQPSGVNEPNRGADAK